MACRERRRRTHPHREDPVCGMNVDSATARYQTLHNGKQYFFCCAGCLIKFQAIPRKFCQRRQKPMSSGPGNSRGSSSGKDSEHDRRACCRFAPAAKVSAVSEADGHAFVGPAKTGDRQKDTRAYVCRCVPRCGRSAPGHVRKCGMALDPELPAPLASKIEYTCPMQSRSCASRAGSLSHLWHGSRAAHSDGRRGLIRN